MPTQNGLNLLNFCHRKSTQHNSKGREMVAYGQTIKKILKNLSVSGTFGKSKYIYYGRHSEGNRFIRNTDL